MHSRDFWDCYFRKTKLSVKKRDNQPSFQQPRHPSSDDDEEDENCSFGSWASGTEFSDYNSDGSSEESIDINSSENQSQPSKSFYKQVAPSTSLQQAFQQLVQFVQGLPKQVKEHRAAAHLKSFASWQVCLFTSNVGIPIGFFDLTHENSVHDYLIS